MKNCPLPRIDEQPEIREQLLPFCRLKTGEIWTDPIKGHRVGCLDAGKADDIDQLMDGHKAQLAVHDPPYNVAAFERRTCEEFIAWCESWVRSTVRHFDEDAALYVWLGADQTDGFQPLPDFMIMMRRMEELQPRSFITMRNQRGYGTQHNWMAIRQELLYYCKGKPVFTVQYTDIPKVLKGYYKKIDGEMLENMERSKSPNIRPGNVWIDVQQVFYRLEENVSGCFAQKPLKAIERIVSASSVEGATVVDFFSHSGTTLIACENLGRQCFTADIDPIFCEITIRRLERFRSLGKTGWQNVSPFDELPEGTPGAPNGNLLNAQQSLF